MLKRGVIFVVLLLVATNFTFAGGSKEQAASTGTEESTDQKVSDVDLQEGMVDTSKYKVDGKVTIGVSYEGPINDYTKSMLYHIQYQLERNYADRVEEVIYAPADGDANKQINTTENLLAKDIDLLLYQPISESAGVVVIEKAMSMGVPVVIFGASLLTDDYVSYVNIDNTGIGFAYTEWLAKQINGKGKVVVMLGEAGSGYTEDTYKGIQEALKKYPNIVTLPPVYAFYSQAKAKQQMETLLNAHSDIVGAIVQGGHMGLGILEACLDKGIEPPFMTVDDINLFMQAAKKYKFNKYIVYGAGAEVSFDACDIAMDILDGKPVPKKYVAPVQLYTAEEVLARIPEGMSDGFWSLTKIPQEFIKDYYKGD